MKTLKLLIKRGA